MGSDQRECGSLCMRENKQEGRPQRREMGGEEGRCGRPSNLQWAGLDDTWVPEHEEEEKEGSWRLGRIVEGQTHGGCSVLPSQRRRWGLPKAGPQPASHCVCPWESQFPALCVLTTASEASSFTLKQAQKRRPRNLHPPCLEFLKGQLQKIPERQPHLTISQSPF